MGRVPLVTVITREAEHPSTRPRTRTDSPGTGWACCVWPGPARGNTHSTLCTHDFPLQI